MSVWTINFFLKSERVRTELVNVRTLQKALKKKKNSSVLHQGDTWWIQRVVSNNACALLKNTITRNHVAAYTQLHGRHSLLIENLLQFHGSIFYGQMTWRLALGKVIWVHVTWFGDVSVGLHACWDGLAELQQHIWTDSVICWAQPAFVFWTDVLDIISLICK